MTLNKSEDYNREGEEAIKMALSIDSGREVYSNFDMYSNIKHFHQKPHIARERVRNAAISLLVNRNNPKEFDINNFKRMRYRQRNNKKATVNRR